MITDLILSLALGANIKGISMNHCINCKVKLTDLDLSTARAELRLHGIVGAMADRFIGDGILCQPCDSYRATRCNYIESMEQGANL